MSNLRWLMVINALLNISLQVPIAAIRYIPPVGQKANLPGQLSRKMTLALTRPQPPVSSHMPPKRNEMKSPTIVCYYRI